MNKPVFVASLIEKTGLSRERINASRFLDPICADDSRSGWLWRRLGDKSGEPEVLDVFTRNLTSGMEPAARERVCVLTALAIGRIATPKLMEHLPDFLNDKSKAVRIAAARAVLQSRIGN